MRTLDDVYGSELDGFPLEQVRHPPRADLDWEETAEPQGLRFLDRLFHVHWGPLVPDQR
jgi:hypothetical protein